MKIRANGAALHTVLVASAASMLATPAWAQLDFTTYQFGTSNVTTVTGIRGNTMTGNYSIPNSGGDTGGLLFTPSFGNITPFPTATSSGSNFPGATSSTPYGPSFGSAAGILRVVGSYKTAASNPYDLSYLYDGAAAPGQQLTTLIYPGSSTLNTIAHSNFGNQLVGNYDTILATGNAFLYNIPTGTYTNINHPGSISTTAYGIYGNRIAGGYTDPGLGGLTHGYIYNQGTGTYTQYDAPGASVVTHFEGITGGGRANTYNLVADSVDISGNPHAWAVHVDADGTATWTEIAVPGASVTSGNSVYGNTVIGVYVQNGTTFAYVTNMPAGFYNPITNNGTLAISAPNTTAIVGAEGDDIVNNGTVQMTGAASTGISGNTYGVITNNGTIGVTGAGSTAVQMAGSFGSLLNYGTISAAPGGYAIQTTSTSTGTLVVNNGVIDGPVMIAAGPYARFENNGWLGISAAGAGVTHQISGTFAQTPAGTLALRVGANGVSDSLLVSGQARLAGTALAVFQPGIFSKNYTLLTATGGLTGTFNTLSTQNLPSFLSASLGYGATDVTLTLQSSMSSIPGVSGNQLAVARSLDGAFNNGSGLNAVSGLYGLSGSQIGYALTVLSGSSASVGQSVAVSAGGQFAALMSNRATTRHADQQTAQLAACQETATACDPPPAWSAWATAFGGAQWLNADAGKASPASQQAVGGGAFGGDYRISPQTLVGLAVGLSDSNYSVAATGASGRATGAHFGLYGIQGWNGFYLNAAVAYTRFDGNATRSIAGIGLTETAKSSAISNQLAERLEIGRPFEVIQSATGKVDVTPFAALQPVQLWSPGYTESSVTVTGAPGVFALTYQPQNTSSLPLFVGAQFDTATEVQSRPLNAWVRLAWVHEFMTDRSVTAGFAVLPGTNFTVDGARAADNAARFDLGLKYAVGSQTFLYANGSAELSDRGQSIGGTAGLRIVW